jgi:hypothetical protein
MVDNVLQQLRSAAQRAGLPALFGSLTFDEEGVAALEVCAEGEFARVRLSSADGPIGVLLVDLHDSGDHEDEGLSVGLRGWVLDEDVASA